MRPAPAPRSTVPNSGWFPTPRRRTVGRLALSPCLGEFPQQPQVAVPFDVPQRLSLRHQSALPWEAEFSGKVSAYFRNDFDGSGLFHRLSSKSLCRVPATPEPTDRRRKGCGDWGYFEGAKSQKNQCRCQQIAVAN